MRVVTVPECPELIISQADEHVVLLLVLIDMHEPG